MKVLVVTSYELTGKTPIDRRIDYFKTVYGHGNVEVCSLGTFFLKKRGIRNRLRRIIFHRHNFFNNIEIKAILGSINKQKYDKIILTCPDSELLEILKHLDYKDNRFHIDIRDGIWFENLNTGIENFFLRRYLIELEQMLSTVNSLSTNTPSIKAYYEQKFNCKVQLMLPEYTNKLSIPKNPKKIVFVGGLLRSSIGLSAVKFSLAVRNFRETSVTFIGRFYKIEKWLYNFLSKGKITFCDEIPFDDLQHRLKNFDCGLVIVNGKRVVMPSKISLYSKVGLPFIWIGKESTNTDFLRHNLNFVRVDDSVIEIRGALH